MKSWQAAYSLHIHVKGKKRCREGTQCHKDSRYRAEALGLRTSLPGLNPGSVTYQLYDLRSFIYLTVRYLLFLLCKTEKIKKIHGP